MIKIEVLGSGCPKCITLTQNVHAAVEALKLDCEITKVTEIHDIMDYGIMVTPGLVIDGEVKSSGKVLSVDEIKGMLTKRSR